MARADTIGAQLSKAFPGLRVTSTVRSKAEQEALVAAGKTRAKNSQHLSGNGLDVVLPKGVSPAQVNAWLVDNGITPGEFLNETGKGSGQGTGAHLHIGLAPKGGAKGGDQVSAGGGSSFDRAKAARDRAAAPSMAAVFDAYKNMGKPGGMTRQEAAQFEQAVNDGHIMLPRGASLRTKPAAPVLPPAVVQAYNSHRMDDDPEARAEIERQVAEGAVSLPKGMRLQKPQARTLGEKLSMAGRAALEGIGDLAGMAMSISPMRLTETANRAAGEFGRTGDISRAIDAGAATFNALDPSIGRASATRYSDAAGLATPESDTEKLTSAGITGATQGLFTGPALAGEGLAAKIGATALDVASGGAAGVSQESARQGGAGPVGQITAGLIGGAAPIGLAGSVARIRAPKDLPAVVAETPRAAVIDDAGNLTPHGQEIATRHGVSPEEVVAAYEAPPSVRRGTANDQMPEVVAKEATTGEPIEAPSPVRDAPQETPAPTQAEAPVARAAAEPIPEAPATPQARVTNANEFGIDMTRGQATKSFDVQDAEARLRASNGPQADEMRAFTAKQADQVKQAVESFKQAFGDTSLSPEDRGKAVQDAIRELRDNGQAGVTALYKQARELGQEVPIDTTGIKQVYDRLMVEANVPDAVKSEITQEAARYGLIGKAEGTAENGITTVKIDDGAGGERAIRFYGEPQPLRLDNAEEFRKVISRLYPSDGPRKLTQLLKGALDDATEQAAEKLAAYGQKGAEVPAAMKAAREAHIEQVKTFKASDVVQKIAAWKKGAEDVTSLLDPEDVVKAAFSGVSDLKRVKAVLLSKPTANSKAAWKALQAHGLAEIFEKATQRNANIGGEITEAISGAKLRTAINDFGAKGQGREFLKVLLDDKEFNTLMRLRSAIEDVTIPITGTQNPSGSGNLLMRLAKDVDNQVTAAFAAAGTAIGGPAGAAIGGTIGRTISPAIKSVQAEKQAAETLANATKYTPEMAATDTGAKAPGAVSKAASATKEAGAKTVRAFIEIYGSPRVLAPVIASTTGADQ